MNRANVEAAIRVMQRAKEAQAISMVAWQRSKYGDHLPREDSNFCTDEASLHACGNKACFSGYLALSPEWKAAGGHNYGNGGAVIDFEGSQMGVVDSLAYWLDIPREMAHNFIYGRPFFSCFEEDISPFYRKKWSEVTADDVIEQLEFLLHECEDMFYQIIRD